MTFDSNASSPSASYQRGNTPGNPTFNFTGADFEGFDPSDSVNYVEAQLSCSADGGQAGLTGFSIKKIVPLDNGNEDCLGRRKKIVQKTFNKKILSEHPFKSSGVRNPGSPSRRWAVFLNANSSGAALSSYLAVRSKIAAGLLR